MEDKINEKPNLREKKKQYLKLVIIEMGGIFSPIK